MKDLKIICVMILLMMGAIDVLAENKYDVAEFYQVESAPNGTKAVGKFDKIMEVEYILTPTKIDNGRYAVEVKKIGDNIYQIKDTDLCVETRYCFEYAIFYE